MPFAWFTQVRASMLSFEQIPQMPCHASPRVSRCKGSQEGNPGSVPLVQVKKPGKVEEQSGNIAIQ